MMSLRAIENESENVLHSFIFSQRAKPHLAIDTLFSAFSSFSQPFVLPPGEEFVFGLDKVGAKVVLLETGVCSYCRNDSDSRLLVSSLFAPSVVGLVDSYGVTYDVPARPQHVMIADTECRGRTVLLTDFLKIADELDLWHDIARYLAYCLMVMSVRDRELVGVDSYFKVRSLLIEIWAYPEEYRQSINVLNFIQRRTGISRSRTMKILSELRKGDYISIESGRLIQLKKLPFAY